MKIATGLILLCVAPALTLKSIAAPVEPTDAATPVRTAARSTAPTVSGIVEKEGRFVFSDGSSYYLFKKDGTFKSFPVGRSGQKIDGTWMSDAPFFTIEGKWGWINGFGSLNDTRKMVLRVSPYKTFKTVRYLVGADEQGDIKIYDCYFVIEEIVKIPQRPAAPPK